ncbi:hypothetical protein AB0I77_32410 [Streptomyces sp. NPDC050619]|uniref:hypothetical protein n=1 Tax=Streptomyces sp. NPDC050619 TaxID=3157214 RepID=UPI0034270F17
MAVPGLLDVLLVYMIRAWMANSATSATPGATGAARWPAALSHPVAPGRYRAGAAQ